MRTGRLTGIGVGPGDPELLTLKAVRVLEKTSVVAFISARGRASRAKQIVAAHLKPGTRELAFAMPMTGDPDETAPIYDVMATAIGAELEAGRDVVFLCEGDPLFYGSFAYLLERMRGRYPCAAVPVISAPMAAASAALRPIASREAPLAVLPATLPETRLEQLARSSPQVVVIKVGRHIAKVRAVLRATGLLDDATLVEDVGNAGERVRRLADVPDEIVGYFSLVLARRTEPKA